MKAKSEQKSNPLLKIHVETTATVVTMLTFRLIFSTITMDHNLRSQIQMVTYSSTIVKVILSSKLQASERRQVFT